MRHLAVVEYGRSIGVSGGRLLVREKGELLAEHALCRIKSVLVAKGVSISSNCVTALTLRGIKLFFCDYKGEIVSCLYDVFSHGSVPVRQKQFAFIASPEAVELGVMLIWSKIRAQRSVLKYFAKYKTEENLVQVQLLEKAAGELKAVMDEVRNRPFLQLYQPEGGGSWKEVLMGYEGVSARIYWKALAAAAYLPGFPGRIGRGAKDIGNMALNYGYAVLSTIIINAIINAGMELYAGVLHSSVPGKPSLMLDVIEEYRAGIVDRSIIKMRHSLQGKSELTPALKKRIISEIYQVINSKRVYHGRKIRMESVIQRQMYRLAASFCGHKKYKPFSYKW